jgi:hypothetical protein
MWTCVEINIHSYNAGRAGLGWGGGSHRENVYGACRGYVVVLTLGDLVVRRHFVRGLEEFIETSEFLIRVSPSHSYNAGRAGLGG